MAVDHPAVDLARFLGDFADTDDALFAAGLNAYRGARRGFDVSDEFVRLLARTGAVCSLLGWLVRLAVRRERPPTRSRWPRGSTQLLARVEQFAHF